MGVFNPISGMPGVFAEKIAKHRRVSATGYLEMLPAGAGGLIFDGTKMRDPDNPDWNATTNALAQYRLRAGLLIGKVTTGGKWANSVIGVTQAAYTSGDTSVTVTPQEAVEVVRRVGASGTLKFTGPPSAAGTVATISQSFSAVNTSTGVITVTSLGANLVAGSYVQPTDGSEVIRSFIPDGWEWLMPEDSTDRDYPWIPVRGEVDGSQLLPWPADTSLQQWVRDALNTYGKFVFTEKY